MRDRNATSHSFGLAVLKDGELFNSIIIPKNTPYPVEDSRSDYVTSYDNQETLNVYVLEGESEDPRDCDLVGAYQINGIPRRPAGKTKLLVRYGYDENQIVRAAAFLYENDAQLSMKKLEDASLDQISAATPVNIVFLLDYTGSMSPYIEGVKNEHLFFRRGLGEKQCRLALGFVGFGDVLIGEPITIMLFTDSVKKFKATVEKHPMLDGGDEPESQIDALFEALEMQFDQISQKILILITDASPHNPDSKGRSSEDFIRFAKRRGVYVNIVGPNIPVYANITDSTEGVLIDIARHGDMKQILEKLSKAVIQVANRNIWIFINILEQIMF